MALLNNVFRNFSISVYIGDHIQILNLNQSLKMRGSYMNVFLWLLGFRNFSILVHIGDHIQILNLNQSLKMRGSYMNVFLWLLGFVELLNNVFRNFSILVCPK